MSLARRERRAAAGALSGLTIAGLLATGCGDQNDVSRNAVAGESTSVATAPSMAQSSEVADPEAAIELVRVVSKEGHSSHPVWYHDSQLLELGGDVFVAFNGNSKTMLARLRRSDLEILAKTKVNRAPLGGSSDTTGTDTNRHDVPALSADGGGNLLVLYGGGTLSGRSSKLNGPYWRRSIRPGDLTAFGREQQLRSGARGSAFDFETVSDTGGTKHIFGQHGSGDAGSLIEHRLSPDGQWYASRKVIDGGPTPKACVRGGKPRGCNRFAIARVTSSPDGRLHLVWGYSEASLSGKCRVDADYCDHDLYYAVSADNGASWKNLRGDAVRRVPAAPIAHDDRRYRLAAGHIGLFKAVAASDAETLIVFSRRSGKLAGEKTEFKLRAMRLAGGRASESSIAAPDRAWDSSPVLRRDGDAYTLWLSTGSRIVRFSTAKAAGPWRRRLAFRGPSWSLTGTPSTVVGRQLLVWRGAQAGDHSEVVLGDAPAARP